MARWNRCVSTTFEILPLSTCTLLQQKSHISKGIQPIFEVFASARRCWGWALGEKFRVRRYFTFAMARWKLSASKTFEILLLSTCTLWQQKSSISKVFNRLSKSLPQLEDVEGGHLGGKFQARSYFTFAMARWIFCASTTFEISPFQPVHCHRKNPISPKVFNPFSKSLPQLEDVEGGHLGGKFQARRYFTFAMARWKLCASTTFEISPFQPVHCACKNHISPKVFNRFSKSLPQLEDFEGGHLGGKFEARRYFTFAMAKWKLCASITFEILPLSTCTLCQQKSYISKGIEPIFEIFGSARRCWGRAFGRKVSDAQI